MVAHRLARWDGSHWSELGALYGGSWGDTGVHALHVWDGKLIVAGRSTRVGDLPASNIAAWDGLFWSALGSGISGFYVSGLTGCQSNLIAVGIFGSAGGVPARNIARWDGSAWHALGVARCSGWTDVPGDATGERDLCGLSGTYLYNGSSYRNTDWYDAVGGRGPLTFSCTAEFPEQIVFIYGTDCDNMGYDIATAPMCTEATLSRTVESGTHVWLWVGPSAFSGVPCTVEYWMRLTGLQPGPPPQGACCLHDGACLFLAQGECPRLGARRPGRR